MGLPEKPFPEGFPHNIYITFDLDGLDSSLMPATGTPSPGGLNWREAQFILERCVAGRRVAGLDVVELAPIPGLHHADFTAAKLTHLLMGLAQGRQRPTTCGGTLMKNTAVTFREAKGGEKLVMITAYDYSTARVMDAAGVNAILVAIPWAWSCWATKTPSPSPWTT